MKCSTTFWYTGASDFLPFSSATFNRLYMSAKLESDIRRRCAGMSSRSIPNPNCGFRQQTSKGLKGPLLSIKMHSIIFLMNNRLSCFPIWSVQICKLWQGHIQDYMRMQLWKVSENSRIPTMPGFCISRWCTEFWKCLNMAEYCPMAVFWMWLGNVSEGLNKLLVLNMPGLRIWQGCVYMSRLHRGLNMP